MRFLLDKWYLDVVSPEGRAVILYASHLRLGSLQLHCASVLDGRPDGSVQTRWSLRRFAEPRAADGSVDWSCAAFDLSARFVAIDPELDEVLHSEREGEVRWHCLVPRGRAVIRLGDEEVSGIGYAERLELGIPPWKLGIEELRWGRLLSEEAGIVWIDWRGTRSIQLVARNGRRLGPARVDEDGLTQLDGTGIGSLGSRRVLRQGRLARTLRGVLPGVVRNRLPRAALALDEAKWCGVGQIAGGGEGHAIYEVVRWL